MVSDTNGKKHLNRFQKFLILSLIPLLIFSQFKVAGQKHPERKIIIYNVGFGGIVSGIGAAINTPKGGNRKHSFIKGVWQGCIGGLINYSGKKTLNLVRSQQEITYALPAKIICAAGTSIIENAALGEPFLQNWNIDYGLVRVDFSINRNKNFKIRFLPETIYAIIAGSKYNRLDLKTTLLSGDIAFGNHRGYFFVNRGNFNIGLSYGRSFAYMALHPDSVVKATMAHELIHHYQYKDYQILNTWFKPLEKKVKSKIIQTIFSKYVYLDVPFFFAAYSLEGYHNYPGHYKNFFEFEAEQASGRGF